MKQFNLISLILLLSASQANGQLRLNEIMQSNIDYIMDDRNDFPDSWVEVVNTGSTSTNLSSYKIGDSNDPDKAWQLPSQDIAANSFALIYCDKEADGLHTDFRIDSGKGGAIYLFCDGVLIDKIEEMVKQPAPNVAYGRLNESSDQWGYQLTPTPGAENCNAFGEGILGDPIFSVAGAVYTESSTLSLSLSIPEDAPEGTVIRYTTDCSEPTSTSTVYSSPLQISSTKIIHAKLFCDGYISPRSTSHSYIMHGREVTIPVISISTDDKYFNDSEIGIYVEGSKADDTENYNHDWRRPINIELFDAPDTESQINQLCETRISGAASRGCKYKSLAIYANKRFGKKRFSYEFFPEQRPEQTNFKSLVLRNAGNDFDYLYMRDAIAQLTFARFTDIDYQAWQPAIIYINGVYSGMLNIRERANDNNIFTNYDELEDIDLIENWWEVKTGTVDNFTSFQEFYTEHGHTYDEYAERMDVEEFINFFIMNCYFNNVDFPANNFVMWRPREEGGRWRFIAKDVDYILGIYNQQAYNYQYFSWLNYNDFDQSCKWGNTYDGTRLFRRLMEDDTFKQRFTERLAIYMGDFLNYDRIWADIWQPMYDMIKTEYPNHRYLINQWWPTYTDELSSAQQWLQKRTDFMYQHMYEYYSTETLIPVTVNDGYSESELEGLTVSINDIPLSKGCFNGKFFQDRKVTLGATADEDASQCIKGWKVAFVSSNGAVTTNSSETADYSFTMPSCAQVVITPEMGDNDGSSSIGIVSNETKDGEIRAIFDSRGIQHNKLVNGINIIQYKDGRTQKIIHRP